MPRSIFSRLAQTTVIFLAALSTGCGGGDGVTVRGAVTYDGKPVEKGYVNFHSKEGKGRSVSGEISGGKFTVKNVPAGKCRVEVISTPTTSQGAMGMEESVKNAKQKKNEAKKSEPTKDADEIASNAEGNNQTHEIAAGTELNLTLKPSSSPAPAPAAPVNNTPGPIRGNNTPGPVRGGK